MKQHSIEYQKIQLGNQYTGIFNQFDALFYQLNQNMYDI